jgi:hypothetical protein
LKAEGDALCFLFCLDTNMVYFQFCNCYKVEKGSGDYEKRSEDIAGVWGIPIIPADKNPGIPYAEPGASHRGYDLSSAAGAHSHSL